MYTCVRALLRPRGENQRIFETQVGNIYLRTLATEYSLAYLVLTNPASDHELSLNLNDVMDMVYSTLDNVTVDDWLVSLGAKTLPTSDIVMRPTAASAKFNDAFSAGFKMNRVHPIAGEGTELPDEELTDLRLTKTDLDYKLMYESCLVSVNGLFHITDYSARGLKVVDGGRSTWVANNHDVGLISFREVGKLKFYPVTAERVLNKGDQPLKNGFLIHMPEVDLTNKIVLISIGGFLHFSDHHYKVVGEHVIDIEWYKIPLEHRYYNSNKLLDLSAFENTLDRNPRHGDALDLNQANSDESIKAYMTLSQTFVITIDADNIYYERHGVERTALPGRYYAYERPKYPLQLENGLIPSYIAIPEAGVYSIAVTDNLVNRYVHDTRPKSDTMYWNGARESSDRQHYASAYQLEIGTEILTAPPTPTPPTPVP